MGNALNNLFDPCSELSANAIVVVAGYVAVVTIENTLFREILIELKISYFIQINQIIIRIRSLQSTSTLKSRDARRLCLNLLEHFDWKNLETITIHIKQKKFYS